MLLEARLRMLLWQKTPHQSPLWLVRVPAALTAVAKIVSAPFLGALATRVASAHVTPTAVKVVRVAPAARAARSQPAVNPVAAKQSDSRR